MDVGLIVGIKKDMPAPEPGNTVRVTLKVKEGDKERIQVFQGVVIKVSRTDSGANFTVRRVSYSIGVERTFFLQSPLVEKVEVIRQGKVRRAKMYYLRGLSGKASRLKEKSRMGLAIDLKEVITQPQEEQPPAEAATAEQPAEAKVEQAAEVNPEQPAASISEQESKKAPEQTQAS